jgi:PTH2 family peptidyl-tRNA hydrolase
MADNAQPSPSTANIAAACAILAGVTGYMIGQAKSLGFFGGSPIFEAAQPEKEKADDSEEEEEDSSDSEDDDSTPAEFPGHDEECKMVLVVRTDLGMTKGTSPFPSIHPFPY